jgi:hyperosmotically inducible periplasmic protein
MIKLATPALVAAVASLALAVSGVVWAQSASESMHEAKESTENAASSTGHAISHVYHGTKTAAEDTSVTAKVKSALHEDKITKGRNIHVTTVDGVVTLRGSVVSSDIANHAQHIAQDTSGVRSVRNKLKIEAASAAN